MSTTPKEQESFIAPFLEVLAFMSSEGTPIHTDSRDIVSCKTDLGTYSVSRDFCLNENTLEATVDFSILLNGDKVYGMSGEFLVSSSIIAINKAIAYEQRQYIRHRETRIAKNKEAFKLSFL